MRTNNLHLLTGLQTPEATAPASQTEMSAREILAELNRAVDDGTISYVLAPDLGGDEWIVGLNGRMLTMSNREALMFLAGITAARAAR